MAGGALLQFNGKADLTPLSILKPHRPSSSLRPAMVTMGHNQTYWSSINCDIHTLLEGAIPVREPLVVFEPMHHLVFNAPPITAPALCIAIFDILGDGRRDQAVAAAAALHLMHSAFYVHEHLPLTDRSKSKHGPRHAFGPNIELLTGDGILPFGYELLARSDNPDDEYSDRVLRVIVEMSRAMGSEGMVVEAQFGRPDGGEAYYDEERWTEKREGGFHACGAACGAILGNANEEEVEKLRKFGLYVGMIQGRKAKGARTGLEELKEMATNELNGFRDRKSVV